VVSSAGVEIVSSGGLATRIVLLGGLQTVSAHGTAISTHVSSGGQEIVSGTANGTVVNAGGSAVVSSGGTANALEVHGDSALVMSGGMFSGATISGGSLEVASGGLAMSSTVTFSSGGTLVLDDTKFRGKIASFAVPDTIDLLGIAYHSGTTTLGYNGDDGHGGTLVSDPPVSSGAGIAPPH
jgi:autotransporter passenger strand-loop-strand repeat protein